MRGPQGKGEPGQMTDRDYADLMADGASTTVINSLKSVMGDEGKVNILLLGKLVLALGPTLHFWDVGRCGAEGGGTTKFLNPPQEMPESAQESGLRGPTTQCVQSTVCAHPPFSDTSGKGTLRRGRSPF